MTGIVYFNRIPEKRTLLSVYITNIISTSISVLIPMVLISIVYSKCAYYLMKAEAAIDGNCSHIYLQRQRQRNMDIIKLFTVIVLFFFTCNLPLNIFCFYHLSRVVFYKNANPQAIFNETEYVIKFSALLVLSSLTNVFSSLVYARMCHEVKDKLGKLSRRIALFYNRVVRLGRQVET